MKNINELLRNVMRLFAARNKVLWSSDTAWNTGTKAIAGLDGYNIISCDIMAFNQSILMSRDKNGKFKGIASFGSGDMQTSCIIEMISMGNDKYMVSTNSIDHMTSGNHGKIVAGNYGIVRIVGIEPIMEKIVGGGGS